MLQFKRRTKGFIYSANAVWLVFSLLGLVIYLEIYGYDDGVGLERNTKHIFTSLSFVNLCLSVALFFIIEYNCHILLKVYLGAQAFLLIAFTSLVTSLALFNNLKFAWALLPSGVGFIFWLFVLTTLDLASKRTHKVLNQNDGLHDEEIDIGTPD